MGCKSLTYSNFGTSLKVVHKNFGRIQKTCASAYRFGYNGMEKDDEAKDNGNSYTTEFRQYDPRLGRWLSLDPKMAEFPQWSPYVAFNDNPIFYIDINGDIPWPILAKWKNSNGKTILRKLGSQFKTKKRPNHLGVDMNMGAGSDDLGAPVYATHDGTIVMIPYTDGNGAGNRIQIHSEDKTIQTWYFHLDGFAEGLENGKLVKEGQLIGYIGGSGEGSPKLIRNKKGEKIAGQDVHLHYEIRQKQKNGLFMEINPIRNGVLIDPQVDLLSLKSNFQGKMLDEVTVFGRRSAISSPNLTPLPLKNIPTGLLNGGIGNVGVMNISSEGIKHIPKMDSFNSGKATFDSQK